MVLSYLGELLTRNLEGRDKGSQRNMFMTASKKIQSLRTVQLKENKFCYQSNELERGPCTSDKTTALANIFLTNLSLSREPKWALLRLLSYITVRWQMGVVLRQKTCDNLLYNDRKLIHLVIFYCILGSLNFNVLNLYSYKYCWSLSLHAVQLLGNNFILSKLFLSFLRWNQSSV